jgi:hypothetical protein
VPTAELNQRQEQFVHLYLNDPTLDPGDAYIKAGYQIADKKSASMAAARLLRNNKVLAEIDKVQRERIARLELDGDWVVQGFQRIYFEAMQNGDHGNAIKALDAIGRHLGVFERDNRQKSGRDLNSLKELLRANGFDLDERRRKSAEAVPSDN